MMFTRQPHRRGNLLLRALRQRRQGARDAGRARRGCSRCAPAGAGSPGRRSGSPCLQFHIDRCPAPCVGTWSGLEYRAVIDQVVDFLSGRETKVVARPEQVDAGGGRAGRISRAPRCSATGWRRCATCSSGSRSSRALWARRTSPAWPWTTGEPTCRCFITRDGKLADRRSLTFVNVAGARRAGGLRAVRGRVLRRVAGGAGGADRARGACEDTGQLAAFLEGLRGTKVEVRQAERGDKRRLQEMADRNAALALAHERLREERSRERRLGR